MHREDKCVWRLTVMTSWNQVLIQLKDTQDSGVGSGATSNYCLVVVWLADYNALFISALVQAVAWITVYWKLMAHHHFARQGCGWLLVINLGGQHCSRAVHIKLGQLCMAIELLFGVREAALLFMSVSVYPIMLLHASKYLGLACLQKESVKSKKWATNESWGLDPPCLELIFLFMLLLVQNFSFQDFYLLLKDLVARLRNRMEKSLNTKKMKQQISYKKAEFSWHERKLISSMHINSIHFRRAHFCRKLYQKF